jgi:uncharacterized protein (DUF1330 family)
MPIVPTRETIEELMKGPADTPVVMVNLLTFKKEATGEHQGESGQAAYLKYAEQMRGIVEAAGGRFIWSGRVDSAVIASSDERFDVIGLVEYPSREAFLKIATSPEVAKISVHRTAGLQSQWLIATTSTGELARSRRT